jgi:cytochrome P450
MGSTSNTPFADRDRRFPVGAGVTVANLEADPHPTLRQLRAAEPVSWIPCLDAWLVTSRDLVLQAMRDAETFTVDDPRFSTAQVVGPSMLSTDGREHDRHREPFAAPFRLGPVRERFTEIIAEEVASRIAAMQRAGAADLRTEFTGPVAVRVVIEALGLGQTEPAVALGWYDAIVESVSQITAEGRPTARGEEAFAQLREAMGPRLDSRIAGDLSHAEAVSNAAVLMFGGIETTDAMIALAVLHLLSTPHAQALVRAGTATIANAVEESLRLEPAASVIDRFATRDVELGGAAIARGDLVRLSLAGANRDPAFFPDPDRFDVTRENARHQVAFAHGPHVCLGMHLARLETQIAVAALLDRMPGLRLDPDRPAVVSGLVFRKPVTLRVVWDAA